MNQDQLKVLHYVGTLDIGGEQTYLIENLNRFSASIQNVVCYSYSNRLAERITNKSVVLDRISNKKISAFSVATYMLLFGMIRRLLRYRIDVVVTYSPGLPAELIHLAAFICRKPVVHIPQRACGNQSAYEKLITKHALIRKVHYTLIDKVIALGSFYHFDFLTNWLMPSQKLVTCYIGVDPSMFVDDSNKRERFRNLFCIEENKVVIGFVGRLHPIKGLDKVLSYYRLLKQRCGTSHVILCIIGDGPDRARYEALVRDVKIPDVFFTGYCSEIDVVMNGIDIYVQATDNPLNGISSIEAMMSGKPIITFVRDDVERKMAADTVVEGENGFFVNPLLLEDGVNKFVSIIEDDNINKMGSVSRNMALDKFNIWNHVEKMERVFREVVNTSVHATKG